MSDFITRLQQTPISVLGTELDFNTWFGAVTAVILGFVLIYVAFFSSTRQKNPEKSKTEVKERGIPQSNQKTETGKQTPQEKLSEKTPSLSGEKVTQKSLPNTKREEIISEPVDTLKVETVVCEPIVSNGPFLAEFQATEAATLLASRAYCLKFQSAGGNGSRIRRIVHSETPVSHKMAVVQQEVKEQVKEEFIPEKGSLDVMEPEIRSIPSKVQESSAVQDEIATKSNKEENESVKLEEPIVTRDISPTAVEPIVQEKENEIEISAKLEKQQVPAIAAEAIVQEEDKENNTSVDLEKQETPAIAVELTVQEDIENKANVESEEHQVPAEHEAVKSEEPVVSREIPIAVEETPEIIISEDKNEVPETEKVSTEQEPAELEEPVVVNETHIAVVEPIIQDEEKENKTIVESEKQEVSSEEPIVSREIPIVAKNMTREEETEIVTESKEQEVSTKQEQEPVELEEPIVSREIHATIVEEEKEPETTIESEKKAPSPFLAEFHATEAAALLAGQTYSLENASVNSTQQVVKTDEKADISQDMPKENTSQDKVASGPCLAEFHATEAATLLNNQSYSLQNANQTQTAVMHNVASTSEKEDKKEEDKKEINAMQIIPEKDTVLSENSSHVSESKHKEISNENDAVKVEETIIEAPHSLAGAIDASVFEISKEATTPKQEEKEAPPIKSIFEPVENNVNNGHHFETMNDGYMGYNGQFQMYPYPKMMADFAIPSDITPSSQPREKRYLTRLEKIDRQVQSYSPRMKARCSFWPNCTNKNCKYWHPVKECRMGLDCTFKNKCMFLHPDDMMEQQPRRRKPKSVNNKE